MGAFAESGPGLAGRQRMKISDDILRGRRAIGSRIALRLRRALLLLVSRSSRICFWASMADESSSIRSSNCVGEDMVTGRKPCSGSAPCMARWQCIQSGPLLLPKFL
jgi:hypothetical protein